MKQEIREKQVYHHDEVPMKLFGVPFYEQTKQLERLSEEVKSAVPNLSSFSSRVPGARLCFRTDAAEFTVHLTFEKLEVDLGMSVRQAQSGVVFIGPRSTSIFAGLVSPTSYEERSAIAAFHKSTEMEDIMIYLPRNSIINDVSIEVPKEAHVLPPTPYRYSKPILYYGPSITEGGCAMISNCYSSLISRWLDVDFYNFGFSGNARGEAAIAHYINTIEKSIFVYDYDENAPDLEYLEKTHEPFFKIIRDHDPELPIIMMSCQSFREEADSGTRRDIVRKTYENAVAAGDKNVYFIDGETCYGQEDREICTLDTVHPNDLGFYRIAKTVCPVIEGILEEQFWNEQKRKRI